MNEPTMREIAEWLREAAEACAGYSGLLAAYGKHKESQEVWEKAKLSELRAAQVEAMGERRCGGCEWWNKINEKCTRRKWFERTEINGKVTDCGPDFYCIHWKRKEG